MSNKTTQNDLNEKIEITLFKDNDQYKDDVHVIINSNVFVIKRGVPVMVPRYVAIALEDSKKQEQYASSYINENENN